VKVIHIAERDTQVANVPKRPGEFVNTWSVDGFVSEGSQPAELGWGTHEKTLPPRGHRFDFGPQNAIYMLQPGASTRVRTWTPKAGPFHGFLITHGESISIPDYFSHREGGKVVYRPDRSLFVSPVADAVLSVHEFAGRNWAPAGAQAHSQRRDHRRHRRARRAARRPQEECVLVRLAAVDRRGAQAGAAQHGDQSAGLRRGALGHGVGDGESAARRHRARRNGFPPQPRSVHAVSRPVVGAYTDWTPLYQRGELFEEDLDRSDPWQFKNVLV
jgi:homospermidine synthase